MIKTFIYSLFTLLLALSLLLSSCGGSDTGADSSSVKTITDPTVTTTGKPDTTTERPAVTTGEPGTERPETGETVTTGQPTETLGPVTETAAEPEIPGTEITTGFTRLSFDLPDYTDGFLVIGDHIVVNAEHDDDSAELISYDLFTGEVTERCDIPPYCHLLKLDEGDSFILYSYFGSYYRFDDPTTLEMTVSYTVNTEVPDYGEMSDYYTFYSDLTYVNTNYLDVTCGKAGEEPYFKTVLPETYNYATCIGKRGDLVYLTANLAFTDGCALLEIDTVTGNIRVLKALDGFYNVKLFGDFLIYSENRIDYYTAIDLTKPYAETNVYMQLGEEYVYYANGERIISSCNRTDVLNVYVYGYDGRLYYGDTLLEQDGFVRSCQETEYGLFMYVACFPDEGDNVERMIIRIDLTALNEVERIDYNALAKDLELKIEEEFGLELLTGVEAMLDFPGFVADTARGGYNLLRAEQIVYDTLSDFPESFIAELFSDTGKGNCTEFIMCLTGNLDPTEYGSTSDPIAYAYYTDVTQFIVVDIDYYYGMRSTIAHELMHAIDRYLSAVTDYNTYPDWGKYLPKKFKYNNSYVDSYGNDYSDTKYTMWGTSDTYFIDSYSKTFDLEDRARLFENMFTADEYSTFLDYPHILDRMGYLASVIRANFTSVSGSDEIPIWERCLQTAFKTAA